MKIPSIASTADRPTLQMTSMVDVVFLLLIFFVWTASFREPESRLASELSEVAAAAGTSQVSEAVDFEPIVIRIDWQGAVPEWWVGERRLRSRAGLRKHLVQIAEATTDIPVIIYPHRQVPLGQVIDVYDLMRQLGFATVQFAAEPS